MWCTPPSRYANDNKHLINTITIICKGRKGGALASTVHSYYQHGNPGIRNLIKRVLGKVSNNNYST